MGEDINILRKRTEKSIESLGNTIKAFANSGFMFIKIEPIKHYKSYFDNLEEGNEIVKEFNKGNYTDKKFKKISLKARKFL